MSFWHTKWFAEEGDTNHNLNHNLDDNSIVLEIGGHKGSWASQIFEKYNCKIYILEPVPSFYKEIKQIFANSPRVVHLMKGVSPDIEKKITVTVNGDATTSFPANNDTSHSTTEINLSPIESILKEFNVYDVDLVQINIEGAEYTVLKEWINSGIINRFKKLQIQFHRVEGIDCISERHHIQNKLSVLGYNKVFDYPFVWEAWEKI
jgi:FkbM family methyltransferase